MLVDWSKLKEFVDSRNSEILMIEETNHYHLFSGEGLIRLECLLDKNPSDETDLIEFETNYLPSVNPSRQLYDSSGKPYARLAIANEGMILQCMSFNFKTSDKDSLRCKDHDNVTDKGYHTLTLFDENDNATTTNADAVLTRVDFEPDFNYEMIAGHFFQKSEPTSDIFAYLIVCPDIAEEDGGSHNMCNGGFNLAMIERYYKIDGRAPKMLYYSQGHTNKLSFFFYHNKGYQHELQFSVEYYK